MPRKIKYNLNDMQSFQLGAEYIHSNWMYFENSIESLANPDDILLSVAKELHSSLIQIIQKEMDYYSQLEAQYIQGTISFDKTKPLKGDGPNNRDDVLEEIRRQYIKQKNDPTTNLGLLKKFTVQTDRIRRFPRTFKDGTVGLKTRDPEATKKQRGAFKNEITRAATTTIGALLALLNNANIQEILGLDKAKINNPDKLGLEEVETTITDPNSRKVINQKLKNIKRKIKSGNYTLDEVGEIRDVLESLNTSYYFAKAAEQHIPEFFRKFIQGAPLRLSSKNKDVKWSEQFKTLNTIDNILAEVEFKEQEAILGINVKWQKRDFFNTSEYKTNHNIYDVVNAFGNDALKLKGVSKLQKNSRFLLYIRKNLIALESFSLDSPRNAIDIDNFIAREALISFLMNFFRFFNGLSYLLGQGDFAPIEPGQEGKTELPLIYNVFFVTRYEVYYTYDLLEGILQMVMDFEKVLFKKQTSGDFHFQTRKGFTAKAKILKFPNVRSSAANLWTKKRSLLKSFKKEEITYNNLHKSLLNEMESLGDQVGMSLIDSFHYYIKPSLILQNKKSK